MRRVLVDPEAPQRDALQEAAKWILVGGIVALPTDTFYGLAADPFRPGAISRLVAIKGRPEGRALPLIGADLRQISTSLGPLSRVGQRLAGRFWPGPLTLLLSAPPSLARGVAAGTGRVGVRVPASGIARAICLASRIPVTATSANLSGQPATADPDEVERTLGAAVDLLIDAGPTPGGAPSTVVDVTDERPRLVRAGAISWEEIQAWLNLS
ncbi:MAG: threonylcarbamoyl-AMP synthase [Acidobacteria bacterium RIFCSPLOWO2_12_FULL_65_11]|nr:MAG: threonylcarbamoyl-AMP synthase [Acidobacteria bacterium RIFCSPLOWO2_02_FULL_64_15]OFW30993.1 MAG: threonylcarbamoyl-AMP synthase [Acidobacteria bacterium RIFCSPLOWO2_12_FULL_65_11]